MTPRRRAVEPACPAEAPAAVTTDRLLAETGVSRDTLYEWVAWRILPRPRVSNSSPAWPPETLERARFVVELLGTRTLGEISELVKRRWPSTPRLS